VESQGRSLGKRAWQELRSVRTGIVLLLVIGAASAAGTLVLQRPLTDSQSLARAYSPQTLRWLDALGLTDVFHSWWFVALLLLLCANIVVVSAERLPMAWRFFARPYLRPEPHFVSGLPLQAEIPVRRADTGLAAAESALRAMGLRPRRVEANGSVSLFAERHRVARLAAYVVHASLLLILAGGVVDGLAGWRGFVALTHNQQTSTIELRNGGIKSLPFVVRCDGAGQENYEDGTPRRWWTRLAVLENGREVLKKEIEVNEPLVYRGLRFFQSSYGSTGEVESIHLSAVPKLGGAPQSIVLRPGEGVALDAKTTVRLLSFVPDFVLRGNQIETRSLEPRNPAIQLLVASQPGGEAKVWLFPRFPGFAHPDASPYRFEVADLEMGYFTGLQVAYEPGQWAVWAGAILMGLGLIMAFYMVHVRYWVVPVADNRGRLVLWVGASASKNRAEFEARFKELTRKIEAGVRARSSNPAPVASVTGA